MTLNQTWLSSAGKLDLSDWEIHVWRAKIEGYSSQQILGFAKELSDSEIKRANRFVFEKDSHSYIAGRAILRNILSRYLNTAPDALDFKYNKYGKPSLSFPATDLNFNLSHSRGVALYAIGRYEELGVDIEYLDDGIEAEEIGARFFSKSEQQDLKKVASSEKIRAFFNCWTRKEAFIKAVGEGLSYPLEEFDVTLIPNQVAEITRTREVGCKHRQWSVKALDHLSGFAAALVVKGEIGSLEARTWAPDIQE